MTVGLQAARLNALPKSFAIGKGNALHLSGWCAVSGHSLHRLEILVNGQAHPIHTYLSHAQPSENRYDFWALVPVSEPAEPTEQLELVLRAVGANGQYSQQTLAQLQLETIEAPPPTLPSQAATPLIAICMAAFKPDLTLFRRQIESIRAQTWPHWRCIIRDDGSGAAAVQAMRQIVGPDQRFVFVAAPERGGFYHNFERCLALAPPAAEFIALADQDDDWRPHKLQKMLEQFDAETWLVYSDLRVVSDKEEVISPTFWRYRRNNFTDLGALLLLNTVPGAGTMFRRSLLAYVLPFPPPAQTIFHDHWIAVVALALGELKFVDEPLYDWIQHGNNVGGFGERPRPSQRSMWTRLGQTLFTSNGHQAGRGVYETHILPLALLARVAALRCHGKTSRAKQRVLERAAGLDHTWQSLVWLAAQGLRDWRRQSMNNGLAYYFLTGLLWRHRACWEERGQALIRRWQARREQRSIGT